MGIPSSASVILAIELPKAEISVILEQGNIDDAALGVDVPRTARALYEIAAHDSAYAWHHIPVSLARLEGALNTFPVDIVRMRKTTDTYLFQHGCRHDLTLSLERFSITGAL